MSQILNFKADYKGLTSDEAEKRLSMYGLNMDDPDGEAPYSLKRALLTPRFFVQAASVLLLFLSEQYVLGAVMLLLTVMLTVADVIWQLKLYEKESSISRMSGMKFRTVRDGELTLVRKEYLVPDDIIVLQGGERVPADAHLLDAEELTVNEFVFSGSSEPVTKKIGSDGGRTLPKSTCIYKNTLVVSGSLVARIFATGEDAAIKREENRTKSRFEKIVKLPARIIMAVGTLLMLVSALLCFIGVMGADEAEALEGVSDVVTRIVLPALSVGMCFVPAQAEKLIRHFYLEGAMQMNRKHALVKNTGTVEALSAITCVCVEKSGTVTKNQVEVADVFADETRFFANVCVLACEPAPTEETEKAILLYATFGGTDVKDLFSNEREAVYPFNENAKMAGNLWNIGGQRLLCIKGSPEEVLALCNIEPNEIHYIQQKRLGYAKQGRQVLAAAFAALSPDQPKPEKLSDIRYEYIGLIALEYATRDTVPYAVKSCNKAGVRVIMVTGDNEDAAAAIGRQIGLPSGKVITGPQLDDNPDLSDVSIFAQVTPSRRMQLLKMLREQGEIVALVGTDANDIMLLEEADVGISVSGNASPAACESCDMLMSDDNFLAVAEAVKESRQIHRNVKSALGLMMSAHLAIAVFAVVVVATGGSVLFNPVLSTILASILFPVAASMFLGNTADIKSDFTSSNFTGRGIVNRSFFSKVLFLGGAMALSITLFYLFTLDFEPEIHRSLLLMMCSLGITLVGFSLTSRKRSFFSVCREKKGFSGMLQAGILFLVSLVLIYVPYLNSAFGFGAPNVLVLLVALFETAAFTVWPEVLKRFNSVK